MSHVVTCDLRLNDLDRLEKVCKERGWTLHRGKKTFTWVGKWLNDYHEKDAAYHHGIKPEDYGKCEHAISLDKKSQYGYHGEIGLVDDGAGGLRPVWDTFSFEDRGAGVDGLLQSYAVEVTRQQCLNDGYMVSEEILEDGTVVLSAATY